jgi:hypothetical protein
VAQRNNKGKVASAANTRSAFFKMLNDDNSNSIDPYGFYDMSEVEPEDLESIINFESYHFESGHAVKLCGTPKIMKLPLEFDSNIFQFEGIVAKAPVATMIAELAGAEIQRFPISFQGRSGDWEMINLTRAIECLDLEKSEVRFFPKQPNKVMAIRRMVLNANKIGSSQIFRLAQHITTVVVADEFRRRLIDRIDVRGTQFKQIETV